MATKKDFEVLNYLVQKIISKYSNISSGTISSPISLQEIQEDFLHSAKAIKVLLHENKKLLVYIEELLPLKYKNNELKKCNELLYQENKKLLTEMQTINSSIDYNNNCNHNSLTFNEEEEKNDSNQPLSLGAKLLIESMNYQHYIHKISNKFGDDYMLRLINKDTSKRFLEDFSIYLNKLKAKDNNNSTNRSKYKHKSTLSSPNLQNNSKLPLRISKRFSDI